MGKERAIHATHERACSVDSPKHIRKVVFCFALFALLGALVGCGVGQGIDSKTKVGPLGTKSQSIYNGFTVGTNRFSAVLGLLDTTGDVKCSATLITPNKVLTAAHCIDDNATHVDLVLKRDGKSDISLRGPVFVHPQYNKVTAEHDIAIIVLGNPVDAEFAKPIPISTTGRDDSLPPPDDGAEFTTQSIQYITGFGHNSCSGPFPLGYTYSGSGTRRFAVAETVGNVTSTQLSLDIRAARSPLYGDSGGPLLMHREGGFQVTGVASHFVNTPIPPTCSSLANSQTTVRYARVKQYAHWILGTSIRLQGSAACLEAETSGNRAVHWRVCDGSANQQWVYEPDRARVRLFNTDQCLEAINLSNASGIRTHRCGMGNVSGQQWLNDNKSFKLIGATGGLGLGLGSQLSPALVSNPSSFKWDLLRSTHNVALIGTSGSRGATVQLHKEVHIKAGQRKFYKIELPEVPDQFEIKLTTISGDADLYLRKGEPLIQHQAGHDLSCGTLTASSPGGCYCRRNGTVDDECKVNGTGWPSGSNTWYITVEGYQDSTYSLLYSATNTSQGKGAKIVAIEELPSGQAQTGYVAPGEWKYYWMRIPKEASLNLTHLTGDVDLYIHKNRTPTTSLYEQKSFNSLTQSEFISVSLTDTPRNEDWWFVGVRGWDNGQGGSYRLFADIKVHAPKPTVAGERFDWCLNGGTQCGTPAADRYCQIKGCLRSTSHTASDYPGRTLVVGDPSSLPKLCIGSHCRALSSVTCCGSASVCGSICP